MGALRPVNRVAVEVAVEAASTFVVRVVVSGCGHWVPVIVRSARHLVAHRPVGKTTGRWQWQWSECIRRGVLRHGMRATSESWGWMALDSRGVSRHRVRHGGGRRWTAVDGGSWPPTTEGPLVPASCRTYSIWVVQTWVMKWAASLNRGVSQQHIQPPSSSYLPR
jgi:hypothetical protein